MADDSHSVTYRKAVNKIQSKIKKWASLFISWLYIYFTPAVLRAGVYISTPSMFIQNNWSLPTPCLTKWRNESQWG
jgi:hypothetical protein